MTCTSCTNGFVELFTSREPCPVCQGPTRKNRQWNFELFSVDGFLIKGIKEHSFHESAINNQHQVTLLVYNPQPYIILAAYWRIVGSYRVATSLDHPVNLKPACSTTVCLSNVREAIARMEKDMG